MSSHELLEILGIAITQNDDDEDVLSAWFLPEESALNTALRGGDWSSKEYREARIINELAAAHAAGRGYEPLQSPAQEYAERQHAAWQKRRHDENLAQLRGER